MAMLTMPNAGEGVTEGTVTKWLKQEGDAVARDEPVVEIETDKAIVEVPSPFEGRLARILVQADQTVPVGEPLAEFETSDVAEEQPAAVPAAEPARAEAADGRREEQPAAHPTGRTAADGAGNGHRRTRQYSPVVLRLAAEHDIDLDRVEGTGLAGRVTRKDVLRYIEQRAAEPAPAPPPAPAAAPPAPAVEAAGAGVRREPAEAPPGAPAGPPTEEVERVPLSATRRSIARHMSEAHRTIPVAWMVVEADVSGLVALRVRVKDEFQRTEGVGLTYMPFFVQAIVGALKQHPVLNATYTDDAVEVHRRFHTGIAVATEGGLLTPVLRDADRKSLAGLARELDEVGRRARERTLTLDEMRGATFTIDNTGAFGSIISQPIVPVGQVAIITTEAIRNEMRVLDGGSFAARSLMNLCISFDHRALDGAQAGLFMQEVKRRLEAYHRDQDVY